MKPEPNPKPLRRALAMLAAASLLALGPHATRAADPQPYKVTIAPTGDAALDTGVHDSSSLISLHDRAPVGPFALVARAQGDLGRFQTALQSFGHYQGHVVITILGRTLDDPGLPDALDATPAGTEVPVAVALTPGKLFHLRHVTLTGTMPEDARAELKLPEGAPAEAAAVLAARTRLLEALQNTGHALAKVAAPVATLDEAALALDVSFAVDAGPRVDIGPVTVSGLQRVNESFVRRRLLLHDGQPYNPAKIEAARQDLATEGVFSSVRIITPDHLDPAGTLPVDVAVTERKLRAVNLSASYSTDVGGTISASWTHRNLFGNGEQLTLSAAATELGGTAALQPGYNIGPTLLFPDWLQRDQSLTLSAAGIKEYLQAYNRTALVASAIVARKLSTDLIASVGISGEEASIIQEGVRRSYTLAQLPVSLAYDDTGSLFDPVHGFRASAAITPTQSFAAPSSTFAIAQVSGSTYLNLGEPSRSVLALRALVGSVQGASTFQVPPDQRFYAGGGGTIRGYRFQSVGPQFPDRLPVGGTSIDVGSVEFRQRFGESYGAAVFVDAGQVGSNSAPFTGPLRVGAGIGARYYTSIGPIRVDVAVPVIHERGGDAVEAYIGIGQAF